MMKRIELTLADHPQRASHTTFEIVDGQAVIINLNAGTYVSLNETGSFLWERLDGRATLAEIAAALAEEYDVAPAVPRPDVLALAQELLGEGLIVL
jgi:hypothetical protein